MEVMLNEAQAAYAEAIVEAKIVEVDTLNEWFSGLTEAPLDLGEGMCQAGFVNEFELTREVATYAELSVASDIELEMYAAPHPQISRELCVELLCVPLSESTPDPFPLALTNPFDGEGLSFLCELLGVQSLKLHLAAPSHIRHEITACYGTEEEWIAYLAEQGHPDQGAQDQQSQQGGQQSDLDLGQSAVASSPHSEEREASMMSSGAHRQGELKRPQSLPDWSTYDQQSAERGAALREILALR